MPKLAFSYDLADSHRYGWKRDFSANRNKIAHWTPQPTAAPVQLPRKFSQRGKCPNPYNQLALGSCTANMWARLVAWCLLMEKKLTLAVANTPQGTPSRLMIYWLERMLEGSIASDSGAAIYDGFRALNKYGACFENIWPYVVASFTLRPTPTAFNLALKDRVLKIQQFNTVDPRASKLAIFQGHLIGFGTEVFQSFESDQAATTGHVPTPDPANEELLGGHAITRTGWDDDLTIVGADGQTRVGAWEFCNSWGLWGDQGYGWQSYDYGNNPQLTSDLTTALLV